MKTPERRGASRAWMLRAACQGDLAFTERDLEVQFASCVGCPVRAACLEYAIETEATGVVYGGVLLGSRPLRRKAG